MGKPHRILPSAPKKDTGLPVLQWIVHADWQMMRRLEHLGRCSAKGAYLQCKACLGQSNVVQLVLVFLVRATFSGLVAPRWTNDSAGKD